MAKLKITPLNQFVKGVFHFYAIFFHIFPDMNTFYALHNYDAQHYITGNPIISKMEVSGLVVWIHMINGFSRAASTTLWQKSYS